MQKSPKLSEAAPSSDLPSKKPLHAFSREDHPSPPGYSKQVEIPQIYIQDLIERIKPTFLVCDIEGGETALIPRLNFAGVSKVMIELHQRVIGRQGMKKVFDAMSSQGFHYDQWHSCGGVVLFSNIIR